MLHQFPVHCHALHWKLPSSVFALRLLSLFAMLRHILSLQHPSQFNVQQPDTYIKNMDKSFRFHPEIVKNGGELQSWFGTTDVLQLESGLSGMYGMLCGLRKKLHWQKRSIKLHRKVTTEKIWKKTGRDPFVYGRNKGPHFDFSPGIVAINNNDDLFHETIGPLMQEYNFGGFVMDRLWEDIQHGIGDRGNTAITVGFNGGENMRALENDEVMKPLKLGDTTEEDVKFMCHMTDLIYKVTDEMKKRNPKYKGPSILSNPERLHDFALSLCRDHNIPQYQPNK